MNNYPIIPKPVELHPQAGCFEINPDTSLIADSQNQGNAAYLRDFLASPTGYLLSIHGGSDFQENSITLDVDPDLENLDEEGYRLDIDRNAIIIRGATPAGVFYGIQTLRQLLPVEIEQRKLVSAVQWQIPCCEVIDYPRFPWRGFMLDEGRHFQGKQTVRQTLDLMALQKLNIFHWHLTEDQGWRIEIKRYPKLTEIGSRRPGTAQSFNDMRKGRHDGIPHCGFYTQDEIQEIVGYAADRQITIIPEIEIPGHCRAAIASYPKLSCTGVGVDVATGPGIYKDIYCPGKENTFEFLQNVLDEVVALFPSRIIHIGGDEAPKARWKKCPDCQARMRKEGLKNEHELQTYFVHRIADYLASHGRQVIGWNEILEAFRNFTKAPNNKDAQGILMGSRESSRLRDEKAEEITVPIIQYWVRNKKDLLEALRNGQKVVNSAYLDTYLDHSYSLTPLSRAYKFEPVIKGLDGEAAKNLLGLETPMWTEWVPNRTRLDYQTYPRLTAFAEVGWTPEARRDYTDFRERLATFNQRLDVHSVGFAPKKDWDPPWYQRLFGIFTIAQPQRKTR
jgi:hexosaminidase